jgi:hypothetical protein
VGPGKYLLEEEESILGREEMRAHGSLLLPPTEPGRPGDLAVSRWGWLNFVFSQLALGHQPTRTSWAWGTTGWWMREACPACFPFTRGRETGVQEGGAEAVLPGNPEQVTEQGGGERK